MTAGDDSAAPERRTVDDYSELEKAGIRLYVRCETGDELPLTWDHRFMSFEAVAVGKKFPGVTPKRVLAAWGRGGALDDPDAIRAAVWMIRHFRQGEKDLKPQDVEVDLLSIRDEFVDANGVILDPPPPPAPDDELVNRIAIAILDAAPGVDEAVVDRAATAVAATMMPDDEPAPAGPGEDEAGAPPADRSPPSTPTT